MRERRRAGLLLRPHAPLEHRAGGRARGAAALWPPVGGQRFIRIQLVLERVRSRWSHCALPKPSLGRGQSSLWYRESVCSFVRRPRAGRCGVGAPPSASAAAPTHPKGSTSAERSTRHGKGGRARARTAHRRSSRQASKAMSRRVTSRCVPARRRWRWASTRRHRRRGIGSAHGRPS